MFEKEATSYLTPFEPETKPIYWFNDVFPANSWSRPHTHLWGELAFVAQGCIVVCTETCNWLAPPQRAVWIPPGMRHEWYVPCMTRDCSLWIDQRVFMNIPRFGQCHVIELSPLLREIINYLCPKKCNYGNDSNGRLISVLLDQLLEQQVSCDPLAMPRDHRLVELCTALLTTPGEDISLAQWANRLGMSERNLGRLFRRETGTSFRNWRKLQRMQTAHSRLCKGESVTSVALDCGYSSVSAFTATFRQIFGLTPGKVCFKTEE